MKLRYVCEVCGYNSSNKTEIAKHEKIPIVEGSLDGLILNVIGTYWVYKKAGVFAEKHKRLYEKDIFPYDPTAGVKRKVDDKHFGGQPEEFRLHELGHIAPHIEVLIQDEFKKLVKELKKANPKYYKRTKFKREAPDCVLPLLKSK